MKLLAGLAMGLAMMAANAGVVFAALAAPADRVPTVAEAEKLLATALERDDGSALLMFDVWHGLHYLMTGKDFDTESLAGRAILGGQPLGGKGSQNPMRLMAADEVKAVSVALQRIKLDELRRRFNPTQMKRLLIHPVGIWLTDRDESLKHVLSHFQPLVDFYANAARDGHAVLLTVE